MNNEQLSRRKFLKIGGAAAAGALLVPYLGGCGGGDETTTTTAGGATASTAAGTTATSAAVSALTPEAIAQKYGTNTYGLSFHTLQLTILKYWAEGGEAALKALGDQKQVIYENNVNTAKQTSDVESAVQAGNMAMNTIPLDAPMAQVINNICQPAGVYFTTTYNSTPWWTPLEAGDYYVGYYSPDDFLAGYTFAKTLFEHLGGQGNVVHLEGLEGATASVRRSQGVDKALSEYPGIKLLARKPTDWTLINAQKLMENFLVAYPQIDGVMGQDDDLGIGAYNAIRDAGKEIPVVSTDGVQEAIKLIKDSFYLATWATYSHWQCGYTMVKLFDALNGWKPDVAERMMFTGGIVVSKDNAPKYLDTFWGGKPLPYDWVKMSRILSPDDWDPQNELIPMVPDEIWAEQPKPANYNLPDAYSGADFEGTKKLYSDQWKMRLF